MNRAEKFIQERTKNCSNEIIVPTQDGNTYTKGYDHWITPDQARKAVEIAREEMMENVCQFIQEHHHEYALWNTEEYELEFNTEQFIQDIKQAMKDE